jgi:hypothetical protein
MQRRTEHWLRLAEQLILCPAPPRRAAEPPLGVLVLVSVVNVIGARFIKGVQSNRFPNLCQDMSGHVSFRRENDFDSSILV